jgi:putative Holliday junction resolvase
MHIGVDYGRKRVGIAVTDEEDKLAFPLEVVAEKEALARVRALAQKRGARTVVVGESKNFSGVDNPVMEDIRRFASELQSEGLTVVLEPEFLTSAAASRLQSPERLDASAAALILQSYLDKQQ